MASNIPGLIQKKLKIAALLSVIDPIMAEQINEQLEAAELELVEHVSQAINRLFNKYRTEGERQELSAILAAFFEARGASLEVMKQQWRVLMKWRADCIRFAHLPRLRGSDIVAAKIIDHITAQVESDPEYAPVKDAALVMLKVARDTLPGA
jgi:uncharacterized protein YicC (UPF0701 family)